MGTDRPNGKGADGRNAVFYGERVIDCSRCDTGTSARMAQLVAKGRPQVGDRFVDESYICSRLIGRVEDNAMLGDTPGIIPSIEGAGIATEFDAIWFDQADSFWKGYSVL